jgi:hypothetical protein
MVKKKKKKKNPHKFHSPKIVPEFIGEDENLMMIITVSVISMYVS